MSLFTAEKLCRNNHRNHWESPLRLIRRLAHERTSLPISGFARLRAFFKIERRWSPAARLALAGRYAKNWLRFVSARLRVRERCVQHQENGKARTGRCISGPLTPERSAPALRGYPHYLNARPPSRRPGGPRSNRA